MLGGYRIVRLLGHGYPAFTYLASTLASSGDAVFVIKELFPPGLGRDHATGQIRIDSESDPDSIAFALERFCLEATPLPGCDHPDIVRIVDSFRYNGTAYRVTPFLAGRPLDAVCRILGNGSHMEIERIRDYMSPILAAVEYMTHQGLVHRELCPVKIFIEQSGCSMLMPLSVLDLEWIWPQVLLREGERLVEYSGYTPIEQLIPGSEIGPWTAVYSLGAIIHYLINPKSDRYGRDAVPPRSFDRYFSIYANEKRDPYQPLASQKHLRSLYSKAFLEAVDWALACKIRNRPQTIAEWRWALFP